MFRVRCLLRPVDESENVLTLSHAEKYIFQNEVTWVCQYIPSDTEVPLVFG